MVFCNKKAQYGREKEKYAKAILFSFFHPDFADFLCITVGLGISPSHT